MRSSRTIGRALALAAVVVAAAAIAVVLLGSGDPGYEVRARFENASQLVKGNLVQVAGAPIGEITEIDLTSDGQAEVVMRITDEDYAPLRRGTEAVARQASLSGQANRYVDLRLPPGDPPALAEGATLPSASTTSAVDLDQLFNTFDPKTRKALSGVIQGSARSYVNKGELAEQGWLYLNPSLVASSRLFQELNHDTPVLKDFLRSSADLVTDVAEKRDDVAGLVDDLATTTQAIGRQKEALSRAIGALPAFMRRSNTTFVNLRATLDDLAPLVEESKPVARRLRPFLAELRPLTRDARPTLRDLSRLIQQAGADNDLVEATRAVPGLRDVAVRDVQRNGKAREGALPASTKALKTSAEELATARPYAPDLTGWFDDFSHSGAYDALGGASRAAPHVSAFVFLNGVLQPVPPELRQEAFAAGAQLNQLNRCPGSLERGGAHKPPGVRCDLSQVPSGK